MVTDREQVIDGENLSAHQVDEKRQLTSDVLISETPPVKLRYILVRFLREFEQSIALFNLQKYVLILLRLLLLLLLLSLVLH